MWVATASLDTGNGVGSKVPLPTHHIDPKVDAERTYIINSLGRTHPTGRRRSLCCKAARSHRRNTTWALRVIVFAHI